MSSLARWTYVYDLTVWPATTDDTGQPYYGTPYRLKVDWQEGSAAEIDRAGVEFVPQNVYFFEAAETAPRPAEEDRVLLGVHTGQPPVTAAKVRKVTGWGMEAFGAGELPDWKVVT